MNALRRVIDESGIDRVTVAIGYRASRCDVLRAALAKMRALKSAPANVVNKASGRPLKYSNREEPGCR
jgi:Arc/MetJ-type ribon-helix-helix transcriptional regulator